MTGNLAKSRAFKNIHLSTLNITKIAWMNYDVFKKCFFKSLFLCKKLYKRIRITTQNIVLYYGNTPNHHQEEKPESIVLNLAKSMCTCTVYGLT